MSPLPYEIRLGWRFTRSGKTSSRNGFISFISGVSILGIALGVCALIVVLSVMNGFQKEVTSRMLSVISHIEVRSPDSGALPDAPRTLLQIRANPQVVGAAPFVGAQALLGMGETIRGAMIRGIDPALEPQVTDLAEQIKDTQLPELVPGQFGILLGADLAQSLGASLGEKVTLIAPSGQVTPAGVIPRIKQMTVVGVFSSGDFSYDSTLALVAMEDAQKIFRLQGPTSIRVKLRDMDEALKVHEELARSLTGDVLVRDWSQENRVWFSAVQIEKRLMFIFISLVVLVSAFNLVATLVMTVQDKRADIAILRTLGSSTASIMSAFMVQGAISGVLGTLGGLLLGLLLANNLDVIVPAIESALHIQFLPADVYLINKMPSDPRASDIIPITLISLATAFVATLYPSWRASRVNPAQALRYE